MLKSLLSGGLSGSIAITLIYPLETIRTWLGSDVSRDKSTRQFQGLSHCYKVLTSQEGFRGLYKGISISVFYFFAFRSVYFGSSEILKKNLHNHNTPMHTEVICVQATLIFFNYFFYPFDTVRRRLMMQIGRKADQVEYWGFLGTLKRIYQQEGWRGFYNGVTASAVKCLGPGFLLIFNDRATSGQKALY